MRPDHIPHVDIDCHPSPIAKSHENHLKVDVIAEDQPKAEGSLEVIKEGMKLADLHKF